MIRISQKCVQMYCPLLKFVQCGKFRISQRTFCVESSISAIVGLLNKNILYLTSTNNHYIVFNFHLSSSERLAQCSDNIDTHTAPPGSNRASGKHSALLPATSPTTIRLAWMFCRIVSVLTFDLFGLTDYIWPLRISCLLRLADVFCIIINRVCVWLIYWVKHSTHLPTYTKLERVADWLTYSMT